MSILQMGSWGEKNQHHRTLPCGFWEPNFLILISVRFHYLSGLNETREKK